MTNQKALLKKTTAAEMDAVTKDLPPVENENEKIEGNEGLTPDQEDEIIDFVSNTENIDHAGFYSFCEQMGVDKHEAGEVIYRAFYDLMQVINSMPENDEDMQEINLYQYQENADNMPVVGKKINAEEIGRIEDKILDYSWLSTLKDLKDEIEGMKKDYNENDLNIIQEKLDTIINHIDDNWKKEETIIKKTKIESANNERSKYHQMSEIVNDMWDAADNIKNAVQLNEAQSFTEELYDGMTKLYEIINVLSQESIDRITALDMSSNRSAEEILKAIDILKKAGINDEIVFILEDELPEENREKNTKQNMFSSASQKVKAESKKYTGDIKKDLNEDLDFIETIAELLSENFENKEHVKKELIKRFIANYENNESFGKKMFKAWVLNGDGRDETESYMNHWIKSIEKGNNINRIVAEENKKEKTSLDEMAKELSKGKEVEKEHGATYKKIKDYYKENGEFPTFEQVTMWIADDHLSEFDDYYDALDKMEKELKKEEKKDSKESDKEKQSENDVENKIDAALKATAKVEPDEGDFYIQINNNSTKYKVAEVGKGFFNETDTLVEAEDAIRKRMRRQKRDQAYVWRRYNGGSFERITNFNPKQKVYAMSNEKFNYAHAQAAVDLFNDGKEMAAYELYRQDKDAFNPNIDYEQFIIEFRPFAESNKKVDAGVSTMPHDGNERVISKILRKIGIGNK